MTTASSAVRPVIAHERCNTLPGKSRAFSRHHPPEDIFLIGS
jgi:hypothetical protein